MPRHLSAAKIKHFHDITKYLPNYFVHTPLSVIFPLRILATAINTIHENSCVKRQDPDGILPLSRGTEGVYCHRAVRPNEIHFVFFLKKNYNSQILDKRIGIRMVPPPKQGD